MGGSIYLYWGVYLTTDHILLHNTYTGPWEVEILPLVVFINKKLIPTPPKKKHLDEATYLSNVMYSEILALHIGSRSLN